jgi:hypothetical protein
MNTDEGEIAFGGRQDARQREKHLVINRRLSAFICA